MEKKKKKLVTFTGKDVSKFFIIMFNSIYTYSYFYIAQILADVSNLKKKNYYVDLIFLFYLLDVCSYLYKLWGIVSTLYYLVVIQSDKEKKQN